MINANELLDPEFAEGGVFTAPYPITLVYASLKTAKGRIIAAKTPTQFVLFRLDQDNQLDKQFGSDGTGLVMGTFKENNVSYCQHLLALDNDKFVLVGFTTDGSYWGTKPALACFTNDGILDDQFGKNGFVVIDPEELSPGFPPAPRPLPDFDFLDSQQFVNMRHQSTKVTANSADGSFYVLANDLLRERGIILKYLKNGDLDLSFNKKGYKHLMRNTLDYGFATTLHVDEKNILVGANIKRGLETNYEAVIIKLAHNGEFDKTFGEEGFGYFTDQLLSLNDFVVLPTGTLIACGDTLDWGGVLAALTPLGKIDENFISTPFNPGDAVRWKHMTYIDQPSPSLVPIGALSKDANFPIIVARYDTKGVIDPTFADGGYGTVTVQRVTSTRGCESDGDGAVLVFGFAQLDSPSQPFIARLRTNQ